MDAIILNKYKIILDISKQELEILNNALNNFCNDPNIQRSDSEKSKSVLESLSSIYVQAILEEFKNTTD